MNTKTKSKGLEVKDCKVNIELIVPHLDGKLVFIHPYDEPSATETTFFIPEGTYRQVQERITGLTPPTASETASLIYGAFQNPDEPYSQEIFHLLRARKFWGFTGSLHVPKKGMYIQDHPKIGTVKNHIGGKHPGIVMNQADLEKRLESNDPSVRFVPLGFKYDEQSAKELGKNPFIIGLVGEEGAEKLAYVADKFDVKPRLHLGSGVASFGTYDDLLVSSANRVCVEWGFAFGIKR